MGGEKTLGPTREHPQCDWNKKTRFSSPGMTPVSAPSTQLNASSFGVLTSGEGGGTTVFQQQRTTKAKPRDCPVTRSLMIRTLSTFGHPGKPAHTKHRVLDGLHIL